MDLTINLRLARFVTANMLTNILYTKKNGIETTAAGDNSRSLCTIIIMIDAVLLYYHKIIMEYNITH